VDGAEHERKERSGGRQIRRASLVALGCLVTLTAAAPP